MNSYAAMQCISPTKRNMICYSDQDDLHGVATMHDAERRPRTYENSSHRKPSWSAGSHVFARASAEDYTASEVVDFVDEGSTTLPLKVRAARTDNANEDSMVILRVSEFEEVIQRARRSRLIGVLQGPKWASEVRYAKVFFKLAAEGTGAVSTVLTIRHQRETWCTIVDILLP